MANFSDYQHLLSHQANALGVPLPSLTDSEQSWSLFNTLTEKMRLAEQQQIAFTEWLDCVLYQPGLGYYASESPVIGARGDFITAPEMSDLFAAAIAYWITPKLPETKGNLVEFGAGNGTLTVQLLRRLQNSLQQYYIVEVSESLKKRQRETLAEAGLSGAVIWIDEPAQLPDSAIVLGNEVLDAIPAHRFCRRGDKFFEANVSLGSMSGLDSQAETEIIAEQNESAFEIKWSSDLSSELESWLQQHGNKLNWSEYSDDYLFEASPLRTKWLTEWLNQLNSGYGLFLDYGYSADEFFSPERNQGTYQAFYRHRRHNNLTWLPGLQDVTSHVNFSELCAGLEANDWQLSGFCTQSEFILASGVLNTFQLPDELTARIEISQAIQRLMMPGEMGETVKAIAFSHNIGQNARSLIPMQLASRL